MRALLDTNIIIHREANRVVNTDIGILFKWLDKGKYEKCIHPLTINEIEKNTNEATVNAFKIKLGSYEVLKTLAPECEAIVDVSRKFDTSENDKVDNALISEVYAGRVDILISEDKKIHQKALYLDISDKVYTINSFLEMIVAQNPDLIDYKVLSVRKEYFGTININDPFFNSLKTDYPGFEQWFNKKSDKQAYVTLNKNRILSFLYLKVEDKDENYYNITPRFMPKKRLKIGTFKVASNGVKLGERFMKIIFDNALSSRVDEIYATIYDKRDEQKRLICLLEEWGFKYYGKKNDELVYVRDFAPSFNILNPKFTYPFISAGVNIFLIPINPQYHTELLPDSLLTTESPSNYIENMPHRNAICKAYVTHSHNRNIKPGDLLIFYRTAFNGPAYYTAVITTIGIVEDKLDNFKSESDYIEKCKKRSIFTEESLKSIWQKYPSYKPFIIHFMYVYTFNVGSRLNRKKLLELNILTGEEGEMRGIKQISKAQFQLILKETKTNESLIVN